MSKLIRIEDEALAPRDPALLPDFTPVPRKIKRVHGWTAARQRAFIEALADSGSVTDAARQVNMTPEAAYYLRRAEGAESFRKAWEAAVEIGMRALGDLAIDRVRHGNVLATFENGELIREKRWHDNRLLMFMLRHHQPERYGRNAALSAGGRANFRARADSADDTRAEILRKVMAVKRVSDRETYDELVSDPARRAAWELLNGKPLEALLKDEASPPIDS